MKAHGFIKMTTKIKLILSVIVLCLISGLAMWGLWQRNTIVKQAAQISNLTAIAKAAEEEKAANKKLTKEKQALSSQNATLQRRIYAMSESKCIGEEDEKILTDVTDFFNNRGMLSTDVETNKTVLPTTGTTDINKTHWTIKLFVENYNKLVKYALEWEKTYETCFD
jgi:hypothetical protein